MGSEYFSDILNERGYVLLEIIELGVGPVSGAKGAIQALENVCILSVDGSDRTGV